MERGKDKRLLGILSLGWKVLLEKCNNSFIDSFRFGFRAFAVRGNYQRDSQFFNPLTFMQFYKNCNLML